MAGTPTGLRILLLTPQLPYPPQQGTSLRNYHLLRYLAGRHRVSLLSFATPDTLSEHVEHLRGLGVVVDGVPAPQRSTADRLRTLLTSTRPDMAWRLHSADFARLLQSRLEGEPWDVLQAEGIEMAPYLEMAAGLRARGFAPHHPWVDGSAADAPERPSPLTPLPVGGEGNHLTRSDMHFPSPPTGRGVRGEGRSGLPAGVGQGDSWHGVESLNGTCQRPLLVFDDHNAEYLLQQRAFLTDVRRPARGLAAAYSLIQWRRLRGYERRIARLSDGLVAVSAADARAIEALDPRLRAVVVPNGVDLDSCRPDGPALPGMAQPSLVFTGKMDYRPNVDAVLWFASEVLPRLWEKQAGVHFYVVGQAPSPRLDALRGEPRITLTGRVEDVRPYIAGATVYVAPLRVGGGTRLKILEAMAMGKALVATTLGAEGLDVADGREAVLADDPAEMARQILALLDDAPRRRALGRAARAFVERGFGWEAIGPRLEAVYRR